MATTIQLNGQLAGLKGGRRRWDLDPDGALRMARDGSRKFMKRFKTPEERSAYFTDLIRKRWAKATTTSPNGGGAAAPVSASPGPTASAADGGAE